MLQRRLCGRAARFLYAALSLAILVPLASAVAAETGLASFYGRYYHGRHTASGERFDNSVMMAAHRHYPFGTHLRVTNLANGRSVVVRVTDRGPFGRGRIIDVSYAAAQALGFTRAGVTRVSVERGG